MSDDPVSVDRSVQAQLIAMRAARYAAREGRLAPGGGGTQPPSMDARVSALEADSRLIKGALDRIEPKVDGLDARLRAVEVSVGKIDGKLDLLVAKMPSWWQQPVSVAAIVALLAAAIALAKAVGVLH